MRKWEKKWDTTGAYAKYTWFPCTLVQTRKFVPLGDIDASVQASMPSAMLLRTRSALSLAEKRAVELSLREQKLANNADSNISSNGHAATDAAAAPHDDGDDSDDKRSKRRRKEDE